MLRITPNIKQYKKRHRLNGLEMLNNIVLFVFCLFVFVFVCLFVLFLFLFVFIICIFFVWEVSVGFHFTCINDDTSRIREQHSNI